MFSSLEEAYGTNNYDAESDNIIGGNLLKSNQPNLTNNTTIHYSSATGATINDDLPFPRSRNIDINSTPMKIRPVNMTKKKGRPIDTATHTPSNIQNNRADSFRFHHGDTTFYSDENSNLKYNASTVQKYNTHNTHNSLLPEMKSTYLQATPFSKSNESQQRKKNEKVNVQSLLHKVDHLLSVIENLVKTKNMSSWVQHQKSQLLSERRNSDSDDEEEEEEEEEVVVLKEKAVEADAEADAEAEKKVKANKHKAEEVQSMNFPRSKSFAQYQETKDIVLHAILGTILGTMVIFLLELFFRFITE